MKLARDFVINAVVGGIFVVVPVYLAVLLLLKGMQSVASLVRPVAALVPDTVPAENPFVAASGPVRLLPRRRRRSHPAGRRVRERLEVVFFETASRIRSAAQPDPAAGRKQQRERLAAGARRVRGRTRAGVHHRGALDDGRFTVFVPSVPTPLAGAVYILAPERVHIVDIPFSDAIKSISRWGSGTRDMVAAMRTAPPGYRVKATPAST